MRLWVAAALAVAGPLVAPLGATSYVPMSDAALADQAELVVEVRVAAVEAAPPDGRPATDYLVEIERVLKGSPAASTLIVRVPGGVGADGVGLRLYGAPRFQSGDRALLFLDERPDGSYAVVQFMLGAFHVVEGRGRRLAVRDLSEATEVGRDASGRLLRRPGADRPRDLDGFGAWLEDRARGERRSTDYQVTPAPEEARAIADKFTLFTDDAGRNLRWFEFDVAGSVSFLARSAGQPGLPGRGFAEFQTALRAWSDEPQTPIRYLYGGTTELTAGLEDGEFDGVNTLQFEDPRNAISGSFGCPGGGTLAVGGPWFSTQTTTFNGVVYARIISADIVTQDGIACYLESRGNPARTAEELYAHELGHTLGLRHACGDDAAGPCNTAEKNDALMRANIHGDGRGARLGTDDLNGIRRLYGTGASPVPRRCVANAQTLCLLDKRFQVTLAWQNQFNGTSGAGRALPRTNLTGFFAFGDPSNVELMVKILDFGDVVKVFYGQLTDLRFTLTVVDTETATIKTYTNTSGNCGGIDQAAFDSARAPAAAGVGVKASAARTAAATTKAGSCKSDRDTLCLFDRRFAVEVDWRSQFDGSGGKAGTAAVSKLVGTFFFSDPANVELMTKLVDLGDSIAFFYGVLSDLEYTIKVTDTTTGQVKTYHNNPGNYCGGLDRAGF